MQRAGISSEKSSGTSAAVAREAGGRLLRLMHFSARYSRDASELGKEGRECFENTLVGKDGMEVEVEFQSERQSATAVVLQ